jgi:hypothetical protein
MIIFVYVLCFVFVFCFRVFIFNLNEKKYMKKKYKINYIVRVNYIVIVERLPS